jgi:hypothetical protein
MTGNRNEIITARAIERQDLPAAVLRAVQSSEHSRGEYKRNGGIGGRMGRWDDVPQCAMGFTSLKHSLLAIIFHRQILPTVEQQTADEKLQHFSIVVMKL